MPAATLDVPPSVTPVTPVLPAPESFAAASNISFADLPFGFPNVLEMRLPAPLSREHLFSFCQTNRDFRIEQDAHGKVIIMPPAGGESSSRNLSVSAHLYYWTINDGTGKGFDSSGGFILPNGATRSPDASWVLKSRLAALTAAQKEKFLPLCPDFVVELRSPSDALAPLKEKMEEYRQNGARLGWLIDVQNKQVLLYRENETDVETLDNPQTLSGETVLPGFVLPLTDIWTPL